VIDFMNFEKQTWFFAAVCCGFLAVLYGPLHSSIGSGYGCWQFFVIGLVGFAFQYVIYLTTVRCLRKMVALWSGGSPSFGAKGLLDTIGRMPEPFVVVEKDDWYKHDSFTAGRDPGFEHPPHITEEDIRGCFPGGNIWFIKISLDMTQLWNCFLLGLYLMTFINNALLNGTPEWIIIMPLMPLIAVLYIG
jgi:hypothetical protein